MIDAAVAEERPPAPYVLAVLEVNIYHKAFFLVVACPVIELALRTSHETAAPKLNASSLLTWVGLEAYAVDSYYRQTIGYGMTSHHGGPSLALALLFVLCIILGIADGCRIDEGGELLIFPTAMGYAKYETYI